MPNFNQITIIGHVGNEPELRFTPNGMSVTNFSVAVNRVYTTNEGERKEETEWFNCVTWGKLAETVNQYVSKGNTILVTGRIHLNTWENEQHEQRSRLQLNANAVQFLTPKESNPYDMPPELNNGDGYVPDDDTPF